MRSVSCSTVTCMCVLSVSLKLSVWIRMILVLVVCVQIIDFRGLSADIMFKLSSDYWGEKSKIHNC